MARDLYETLGVSRDADEDTIKKAFRKLALKYHPDKNPGKANEQRFKEVNHANDILSNKDKRALYDEFGEESLQQGFDPDRARVIRQYGSRRPAPGPGFDVQDIFSRNGGAPADFGDLIGDMFGRARQGRQPRQARGADFEAAVTIDFASAVRGTMVQLQRGSETVSVRIPAGADEGSRLKIAGQGGEGSGGGPPGDLMITVHVTPHPLFRREGDDLYVDVPLTIGEAYRGQRVRIPTPEGDVTMKVPPHTQSGQVTRLRGKGVARKNKEPGDLYVKFLVLYPAAADPEVDRAIETLDRRLADPRTALKF